MTRDNPKNLPPDVKSADSPDIELKEIKHEDVTSGDASEKFIGKTIGEKYEVLSLLGSGGLGMVFKARHKIIDTPVAIKVILPGSQINKDLLARFNREAKTAMGLKHPNIAGVQDIGVHEGMPFIVMEYVEGKTLKDMLQEKVLSADEKTSILKQICQAMEFARTSKVVHRDLKPANIVVSDNEDGSMKVKVIDFGIAKVQGHEEELTLTRTGDLFGTPAYMSPEQCMGQEAEHTSDIYALGCITHEVIYGTTPFTGNSTLAILNAHVMDELPKLKTPDELPGMEIIVNKAMAKKPEHRYSSAKQMREEIERVEQGLKPTLTHKELGKKTKEKVLKGLIISAIVFLLGFLWFIKTFEADTIQSLTVKIKSNPKSVFNLIERGRLYAVEGQYQFAISDYDKAIKYADNDPSNKSIAYIRKGSALNGLKKYDEALDSMNKGIAIKPEGYRGYLERGLLQKQMGRRQEAVKDLKRSIELNHIPNQEANIAVAYASIAEIHNEEGDWNAAIDSATKALTVWPGYGYALNSRVVAHYKKGDFAACLKDCEALLTVAPKSAIAFEYKGKALTRNEQYDKAISCYDELISIKPDSAYGYALRGHVYTLNNNFEKSEVDLSKAIQLNQKYADAYQFRSMLYQKMNKLDLALSDATKTIELNPKSIKAYNNRSQVYKKMNKMDLALKDSQKAMSLSRLNKKPNP